ncbi:unnamed protein product [Fraxinus pennsylvanica]|uniref:Reverse transcriptase zinc-binding domain-containing protein n=1 Tax=Fraxinus pennsylvanica TaxID=56036 RepID=A0AAD2A7K8_9LAMI|nr:unnamed protein product [Fraxinus pennsylvanica]
MALEELYMKLSIEDEEQGVELQEEVERPYGPFLRAPSRNIPGLTDERWLPGSLLERSDSKNGKSGAYNVEEELSMQGGRNQSSANKGKGVTQGLIPINPIPHALPPLMPNMKENPLFKEGPAGDSQNQESNDNLGITIMDQKRRRMDTFPGVNLNNLAIDYDPMHEDPKNGATRLKDKDGNLYSDKMAIQGIISEYFHDIFKSSVQSDQPGENSWDYNLLADLFNEVDRGQITKIPLTAHGREDRMYWIHDKKGVYTVRSGYKLLMGNSFIHSHTAIESFWNKFWRYKIPAKVRNLLWRALRNVLPTVDQLRAKFV